MIAVGVIGRGGGRCLQGAFLKKNYTAERKEKKNWRPVAFAARVVVFFFSCKGGNRIYHMYVQEYERSLAISPLWKKSPANWGSPP